MSNQNIFLQYTNDEVKEVANLVDNKRSVIIDKSKQKFYDMKWIFHYRISRSIDDNLAGENGGTI